MHEKKKLLFLPNYILSPQIFHRRRIRVVFDYRDGGKQEACHALYRNDRILCQAALKVSKPFSSAALLPVRAVTSCDESRQAVIATEDWWNTN